MNLINQTNYQYKNEKMTNYNRITNKLNNTSSQNPSQLYNISENQLYMRKNENINNNNTFQPLRSEQLTNDASDHINMLNGTDNYNYKYRITRINIDSRHRNIIPKNIISNATNNNLSNPFALQQNKNIIQITFPNHGLSINDKITISNVNGHEFNLREIEITKNNNYIRINHQNHGMIPLQNITPYQIFISNVSNYGSTYIKNIPLNVINGYHTVYFNTESNVNGLINNTYDPNFYYIYVPVIPNTTTTFVTLFKVTYKHLYGIPLNSINANYPINADQTNGFQTVYQIIDSNNFYIQINNISSTTITKCGGDNVSINKIIDYIDGYTNNNHYKISLNKTFYNVTKLRLVSSEFPNTDKVIKDSPIARQNNLLIWQSLGDGDTLYKISINTGNYTINDLITEINTQVSSTKIVNTNIVTTNTYSYSPTFISTVVINPNTNLFSIKFFGTITIQNPFNISVSNEDLNTYFVNINHPNHLLQVGTVITIQNSLYIGVVPDYVINSQQTIYRIIDENNYIVKLNPFNILQNNSKTISGFFALVLSITEKY
jgi:hypothetical protein